MRRFRSAEEGLHAELMMLDAVANGRAPASGFFWQAEERALVLPSSMARGAGFSKVAQESAAAGWPVVARRTGGGITPQGPGVINLALAYPLDQNAPLSIEQTYGDICAPLISACASFGIVAGTGSVPHSFCDGAYNLEVGGRKLVGTAQRIQNGAGARAAILAHALILIDLPLGAAVAAISALSQSLGGDNLFDAHAHVCLRDLIPGAYDPRTLDAFCGFAAVDLRAKGFTFWEGQNG